MKHLKANKLGTEGKEGEHNADTVPAVTRAYNIYIYIYIFINNGLAVAVVYLDQNSVSFCNIKLC